MTGFALGVHVFNRTGSAAGFGLVVAALFVPSILLRPVGGVLADRLDRRLLIAAGDLGSAAAVLFLLLSLTGGGLTLPRIYIGVAMSSAFSALQGPAYKASVSDLLGSEHFARAGGMMQLASAAQHLLSPMAAGLLLATAGLEAILIIDVATFAVSVAAVLALRAAFAGGNASVACSCSRRGRRPITALAELRDGVAALRADHRVTETVLLLSVVTFFVGLLQTLFAPMMLSFTDAKTLGVVQSVSASGMIGSSLLIGVLGIPFSPMKTLTAGLAAAGLFLGLLGTRTDIVWITSTFFLFFLCLPLVNTGAEVEIRNRIPNEYQGRVWGIIGLLSQGGYITAYLFAGVVADAVFTPLLLSDGALAGSVGRVFGVGPGRGIALMLTLSGLGLTLSAALRVFRERHAAPAQVHQGAYQT
jgi:MFS family permease